jgi:hypothetical protein
MKIIRAVTCDDPFGEPWPPHSTHSWHVVLRIRGYTVWRAIEIVQTDPPSPAAHDLFDGNCHSNMKGNCHGNKG